MLNVYLVRHGWTAFHSERRVAGWLDVPLDERGRAEAATAGSWLAHHCPQQPAALISSPVLRARQTAEAIGAAFRPAMTSEIEQAIGETQLAQWQGRLVSDIEDNEPTWPEFFKAPADFRYPGGETTRELQGRVVAGVEAMCRGYSTGSLILVSHADPIRSLIAHWIGLDVSFLYRLHISTGSISLLSLPSPEGQGSRSHARLDFMNLVPDPR